MLTLRGSHASRREQLVLTPFDIVEPLAPRQRMRHVTARRWRHACRRLLADSAPPASLRSARLAAIDLLPHQLEPALAVLRGTGCRLLLADEVGLGKTIQAALIVAELRARGWADRILIVTPAGIREQWAAELRDRLALSATIADAAELRRLASLLPGGINPWTAATIAVASVDYIKRPEVLPALMACRWDVVIIDEAHGVTADSDRYAAANALARAAGHVILISATPHNGDRRAFASLCRIGRAGDDDLIVFRRSREEVGLARCRRVCRLWVGQSDRELRMHAALERFAAAVRRERGESAALALSVLQKRACSSARSLDVSVSRRLAALENATGTAVNPPAQFFLPLDDESGDLTGEDLPPAWSESLALGDSAREGRLLCDLRDAARLAAFDESKIRAVRRLLRRMREPAIVFTEYRDTLSQLHGQLDMPALMIHGGVDRSERAEVLHAFAAGHCRVLLATDAAGEGLNLQRACRLVINFELPWNPMRLEQRIGRVDRIGQRCRVHVVHLLARHTGDDAMLRHLTARMAAAREQFDVPDPLADGGLRPAAFSGKGLLTPALTHEADDEARRVSFARRLNVEKSLDSSSNGPLVARARRAGTREFLAGRFLLLFAIAQEDGWGRVVESTVVPVTVAIPPASAGCGPAASRLVRVLEAIDGPLLRRVRDAASNWQVEAATSTEAFLAARLRREQAIADSSSRARAITQPGLFDARAQLAAEAANDAMRDDRLDSLERVAAIGGRHETTFSVRLALALAP